MSRARRSQRQLLAFTTQYAATSTSRLHLIAEQLDCSSTMAEIEPAAGIVVVERLDLPATLGATWPDIHSRLFTRRVHCVNSASSARPADQEPPNFAGTHALVPYQPNSSQFLSLCGYFCLFLHS